MLKNIDITAFARRGGGKLSEIKGFSPNSAGISNSFPHTGVILNSFQNLSAVLLNLFQNLKNFISRIGLYKPQKQAKNSNVRTSSVAFTLAETLITIGMIGVIAALTLPTLMNSTDDKEIVARVKKMNSALSEAYGRAYAKYGPVSTWFTSADSTDALKAQRVGKRMTEFMSVEKDCGTGTGCWTNSNARTLNGVGYDNKNTSTDLYKVLLSDGSSLAFDRYHVYFDIDGPNKGKNVFGEDVFCLIITDSRVITGRTNPSGVDAYRGNIDSATAWVLMYDNVDYLQLDINGKCPNGTTLSASNPTCN